MDKEQFLKELEQKFDDTPWEDILTLTHKCMQIGTDTKVQEMVHNIHKFNRISFQQWKYLRWFNATYGVKNKKYRYGK